MGEHTTAREFHLPLEQIAGASADGALRYLEYRGDMARLGLAVNGEPPFADAAASEPAPPPAEPAPVSAPWCVTLLSPAVTLSQLRQLLTFFAEHGWPVTGVDTLAQSDTRTVLRFQIDAVLDFSTAKHACLQQAEKLKADLVLQPGDSQRVPALAGFDMDSTLIDAEVIDELAKITGIGEQVAAITEAAMRGQLDFRQSFKKRMALLKGFPETRLAEIAAELPLKDGAAKLLGALRALGCKTAILSGGFTYFAHYLQRERLPVDFVHANQLEFAQGALTGDVIEPIVDGARKRALLQQMAEDLGLGLDRVIAVGDGANDIPMLNLGALGIAIHPKPKVRLEAPQAISGFGLDAALYLFGLNDAQIGKLTQSGL
ncbi:phosphoserine phosphatase SerB [Microbulbifer thermotolerans]|uniref:phosphoserine phosphatase SerB n=1 Tax=Microbulbifer thermotolerans TaxID=252514 RepID=UPI0026735604|nr:phosphoserine phosphatase SerB [Microbulbifer thermotolerans]WKT60928.1 phosphoserine phosphatase SerB [Microbulbifer thermotolerans]